MLRGTPNSAPKKEEPASVEIAGSTVYRGKKIEIVEFNFISF
jgi:hypothetical protein